MISITHNTRSSRKREGRGEKKQRRYAKKPHFKKINLIVNTRA